MAERRVANRESEDKVIPMGELKHVLPYHNKFTTDEYEQISLGLIPLGMDEKWLIFLENDWLYFHRSWTGHCIYQIRLESKGNYFAVAEAWVQRDPVKYKQTNLAYDVALLTFLIENFLLSKKTPFPVPNDLPEGYPKGAYQHSFSGSGYPEIPFDKMS